jgi:peptidyl-prolyl cis-trans isomerase A (cyclophilin A)
MAGIVLCTCLMAQAQTPAPKSSSASKSTTHVITAGSHPSMLNPKSLHATAPAVFKAKFTTSAGDFVVEVHRDWAPLGADRFYNLVRNGYYNNAAFFRVITGFVAQFGLSANPAVNKAWKEATLKDDPVTQSNKRGTLVFADAGPNTRTTQLFINFADNSRLDAKGFAPFGTVTDGMDAVDKIFPGYRDQPDQDQITEKGDAYLKANFPYIDRVKLARILPAAPAPLGSKPPAKPSPKPTQH